MGPDQLFALALASAAAGNLQPVATEGISSSAQSAEGFVPPGWRTISTARGDLNRDGRPDIALALWPASADERNGLEERAELPSYRLVIGFADRHGGFRLVADNGTLLGPPDPTGVNDDPLEPDALRISGGSLDISRAFLRGHYRYRFRWSGGAMRLIGYEFTGSDGRCITTVSANYLTRKAIVEKEALDDRGEARRFERKIGRPPVTIAEAGSEGYYQQRDFAGPPTFCVYGGERF